MLLYNDKTLRHRGWHAHARLRTTVATDMLGTYREEDARKMQVSLLTAQ